MKPYYRAGGVAIYHADAREVLSQLNSESVDLVLTDPPYGINYKTKYRNAGIAGDDSLNALRDVLPALDLLLKPDRHAYFFASSTRIGEAVDAIAAWWNVKNILVWDKGNMGTKGDVLAAYARNWEAIVYANKGRRPLHGPRPRAICRYDWNARKDPVHPTVKPVGLMSWLIQKSSRRGELVLDAFCGSGPVLRAARDLGRRAIGIELDERYCEAAVRRLEADHSPSLDGARDRLRHGDAEGKD